ncbi:hypothetical protein [Clostridium sp.]|uniref:hypothetical protein n=1 Tax=Clostridium sp. TaxID=1506 RepID=UPI00321776A7
MQNKSDEFIKKWEKVRQKGFLYYMITRFLIAFSLITITLGIISKIQTSKFFSFKNLICTIVISFLASYINGWTFSEKKYNELTKKTF